jgi:hypothetical protein
MNRNGRNKIDEDKQVHLGEHADAPKDAAAQLLGSKGARSVRNV